MKKFLSSVFLFLGLADFCSQTILFSDDFESYPDFVINNFGPWTTLDLDQLNTGTVGGDMAPPTNWVANWPNAGAKMAYQIFNPLMANVTNNDPFAPNGDMNQEYRNFDAHSGNKYAGSWQGIVQVSFQGNQDWLISPSIKLGSSGNTLSFWVKTLAYSYGDERYAVGIYNGIGTPTGTSDFTIISTQPYQMASGLSTWKKISFNLDAYAGQTIKFGIECLTQEGSMLMIDDVLLTTTGTLASTDTFSNKISVYPNPVVDFLHIKSSDNIISIEVINEEGRTVKSLKLKSEKVYLKDLPSGLYIIKLVDSKLNSTIQKIIKK